MFRTIIQPTLGFLLAATIAACSSTGYTTQSQLTVPRVVRPPMNVHPEVAPYIPRFVALLEERGFAVRTTENPEALELRLEFNPNTFNMRVSVSLWNQGVPVLTASATNSGWGTAMARGAAANRLAESAANVFRSELSKLMRNLEFVEE